MIYFSQISSEVGVSQLKRSIERAHLASLKRGKANSGDQLIVVLFRSWDFISDLFLGAQIM